MTALARTEIPAGIPEDSVRLAGELLRRARELETRTERHHRSRFAALTADEEGTQLMTLLLDRAFRPRRPERVAGEITRTLSGGIPSGLRTTDRLLLGGFVRAWRVWPRAAVGLFVRYLHNTVSDMVVDTSPRGLRPYLRARRDRGVTANVNVVGEAILGREDAALRLDRYLAAVGDPLVPAVAVKLSSLVPGMTPLSQAETVGAAVPAICRMLERDPDVRVTLDMEAYADLEPTLTVYERILADPRYTTGRLGVALQAYLPDSLAALGELVALGRRRVQAGGLPARVRLVKGANLRAEELAARLAGWPPAPFPSKAETDANMKRLVAHALVAAMEGSLEVGVGSHNVFDIAFALTLASHHGVMGSLTVEVLQGMAEPLLRALAEHLGGWSGPGASRSRAAPPVVVYVPVAEPDELLAAVAYLVRRLDENTSPENFLRHAFSMQAGDTAWQHQAELFLRSCTDARTSPRLGSRRLQDRTVETPAAEPPDDSFLNTPDTDWTVRRNREWLGMHLRVDSPDLRPPEATLEAVDTAVQRAGEDKAGWSGLPLPDRAAVLREAAREVERRRGALIALMAHEGMKTPAEADPEVSEAVDLLAYYAGSLDDLAADGRLSLTPRGTVAVLPPWNFPLAIPLGGVAAALIGGNRVILKPSPFTVRTASAGVDALRAAGVPGDALTLLHGGVEPSAALAAHAGVDAVVFTGSTATATRILAANPHTPLLAETGGKNSIVVTAVADRDLALASILRSAFGHAGQKCSAASLVVAEAEVYDDPDFRARLVDAAATLRCGPPTDPATDVPPLVTGPNAALQGLYDRLPHGERWALAPRRLGPRHFSPGVVWDVQEGSPTHLEELFGPVVGVLRAVDLPDAVRLQNAGIYGLTAGLQSLDREEWRWWSGHVQAGNLYVNRPTTGAVVSRQPFGGWRRSGFGPGGKAGGPNYAAQLVHVASSIRSGDAGYARLASVEPHRIEGQRNVLRYVPAPDVVVRVEPGDSQAVVDAHLRAAAAAGCEVTVSSYESEPAAAFAAGLADRPPTRVVRCGAADPGLVEAATRTWTWVCDDPPTLTPRDLLPFVREQTVSIDTHRYGWVARGADHLDWLT
ncbi:MAG: bifunctional proline dehydrogenase/L-glutamate gamma-semialdehyde dehydrogenase [Acidimicrobiia bacterium]|nr:bifunctional proline dehydrogenase/L-glutamate gamma-semialdehyde dehydrogenase [Acidimicrobiia bacterium]